MVFCLFSIRYVNYFVVFEDLRFKTTYELTAWTPMIPYWSINLVFIYRLNFLFYISVNVTGGHLPFEFSFLHFGQCNRLSFTV